MDRRFFITELILVKADWNRVFIGNITRNVDCEGMPVVYGSVCVDEGKIYSRSYSEEGITRNLDEICKLKLDHSIHDVQGRFIVMGDHNICLT